MGSDVFKLYAPVILTTCFSAFLSYVEVTKCVKFQISRFTGFKFGIVRISPIVVYPMITAQPKVEPKDKLHDLRSKQLPVFNLPVFSSPEPETHKVSL